MNMVVQASTGFQALGAGLSVLGERQVRIPVGGKVRSGIKVLTKAASAKPAAVDLYHQGVSAGKSFGEIEKDLEAKLQIKNALTPRNVPYFTVRRADFAMPEVADRIMELYAEDRGDGLHVYRFPVIFPVDSWQACMPHGLKCHTRSELVYWSEYGPDGARYCKTRAAVQVDPRAKRARRAFGGRPVVLRPENGGICDPDQCPEYQDRKCNLSGALLFYIPGVPGSSAIELPTNSFYSLQQARQKMEMVAFLRGGKISGTIDGRPIFYLTKRQEEVSMIDPETGKAKRTKQWIIVLEADIDMSRIFVASEQRTLLAAGAQAAGILTHQEAEEPCEFDTGTGEIIEHDEPAATETAQAPAEPPAIDDARAAVLEARKRVAESLGVVGIEPAVFAAYAAKQWGEHWGRDLDALRKAETELQRAADGDIAAYREKVSCPF